MTKIEQLEDEIFHHSCRISEYNLKLRQAEDGVYRLDDKRRFEYARNAHRESLKHVAMQWLAEQCLEKARESEQKPGDKMPKVFTGRW